MGYLFYLLLVLLYITSIFFIYKRFKKKINYYKEELEELKEDSYNILFELKLNRVEVISKDRGRELVIKSEDIDLSFQDEYKTLKIFQGYGTSDE